MCLLFAFDQSVRRARNPGRPDGRDATFGRIIDAVEPASETWRSLQPLLQGFGKLANVIPQGQADANVGEENGVTVAGQEGLNSFRVFLAGTSSDFQRAKSPKFSVTSVAPARTASAAISRSRKWRTKSICPKVLRARRSRIPVSTHAELGGEEKWPRA